jgi:subtilase family protein
MRRALLAVALAAAVLAATAAGAPVTPAIPNDPGWSGQWGLRLANFPLLWAATSDVRPVIATIDTGVDPTFPDLRNALVPGWDLLAGNATAQDTAGHGTDIAIVIAANANNGYGLAGACPTCLIMPVRISADGDASPKAVAAGIRWAVDHGARIVNVSLAATGIPDPDEQAAVDYAGSHGAVVIAAAGNDGASSLHYPAAMQGVVSVAGTDENDVLYPWSTRGSWVDLAAPGCEFGDDMCGTSYTPPLVAAAVGLLTAADPAVSPVEAVNALRATAVHVAGIAGGRIDLKAATAALGIVLAGPPAAAPALHSIQQVTIQSGKLKRGISKTFDVAAGPLTVLFTRGHARACSMTLRSRDNLYLTWRSTPNELDISDRVPRGRYVLAVRCADGRSRDYSLSVNARFPVR